jgi:ElaB/YqjD/DUF883 family membrane-anchored ribosome-binding protein
MAKTNEQHVQTKDEPTDRFAADLQSLKGSFAELRDDVAKLVDATAGTGRSGAAILKDRASRAMGGLEDRVGDLSDYCTDSVETVGQKIRERPVLSVAIALGIGFLLAKLLRSRR